MTSLSRREVLLAGTAAGIALGLTGEATARRLAWRDRLDFSGIEPRAGWPGWTCPGVANLTCGDGHGVLEAGTDVFPSDPRPVAFAVDRRYRDGEVTATLVAAGAGAGVVARRTGPRSYYAALYDDEAGALVLLRRSPDGLTELARAAAPRPGGPVEIALATRGTRLEARLGDVEVAADDAALQRPGDPGVIATARTLFPSAGPPVLPALGNVRLLPYGVQEGAAFMQTAVGQQVLAAIRERSTARFASVEMRATGRRRVSPASVMAAGSGAPVRGGAHLRVASDLPARVSIEVSRDPRFRRSRRIDAGRTGDLAAALAEVRGLRPGRRVYWRPRLRRRGRVTVGPVRSFRVLPRAGSRAPASLAIGSCASQFGPVFDVIAEREPDVLVWQGDLNYPDTMGPLAQSVDAYAGIWREFLANPRMAPILDRTLFAVQRDDHDYGVQDANATNLVAWGLAPWEALMERRAYYRFSAGLADVWVLDQRLHKTDPTAPDTAEKTLLGERQRRWLLRTLEASRAPFKVICSPCTLAPLSANTRDGSWAAGYTAERELVLEHVRTRVGGRTLFVTGDTHWTMAYERDGLIEVRPCPLSIPSPNDITLTQPLVAEEARGVPGVLYADDERGHVAMLDVRGEGGRARLALDLVREDGTVGYELRLDEPL